MKTSLTLLTILTTAVAFSPSTPTLHAVTSTKTGLGMAKDDAFSRSNRASRQAGLEDRVVELKRPIGVVLEEDGKGNVFVETLAPRGNAARTGLVRITFDNCWSLSVICLKSL